MHPGKPRHQRAWLESVDRAGARAQLPILAALNPPSGWVPDFLAPPPRPNDRTVDEELHEIAGFPASSVVTELQRSLDSRPTRARRALLEPLIADPDAALALIVAELHRAWLTLIFPFWAPVRELIGADIAFRSREITRVGLGRALNDLHPSVSWTDGTVTVDPGFDDGRLDLAGAGLSLMPSAFVWPVVVVVHDASWPPTLVYPARGIGDLWSAPPTPSAALAGVLGRTRAVLLTDLVQPSTTTALAARHRLSPAAVSVQLGRLREAGLVSGQRLGKEVLYRRTGLAEALLKGSPPPQLPGFDIPG
jgi:DNA-binding transcriptional ArsR family regulator